MNLTYEIGYNYHKHILSTKVNRKDADWFQQHNELLFASVQIHCNCNHIQADEDR